MKRIGFDAKRAFENKSGLGNYSRDLIRGMYKQYPENEYFLFSPKQKTELLESQYLEKIVCSKRKTKLAQKYWRTFSITKDIINANIDIYHGLSNELPLNVKNTKFKKIVTIHDLIFIKIPELYPCIDRKIYKTKFLKACKYSDKIIATSQQTKKDIIKYFKIPESKIHVVYQSCNDNFKIKYSIDKLKQITEKYKLPSRYMLNVGTIEQRKNLLNIVKSIYYFNIETPLVVIGKKTRYYNKVKAYIDEHKLNNRIIFLSNVSNEDLVGIYQQSSLLIYPSIYEGFGIPIIEAFNSGVPVITSDKGSTAEISGKAAVQVEALNSKSIGIAMKSVLESSELANTLITEGYERAKLFEKENITKEIMRIYDSL